MLYDDRAHPLDPQPSTLSDHDAIPSYKNERETTNDMSINIERIEDGKFVFSDPRANAVVAQMDPWDRHVIYHRLCQQIYSQSPDAARASETNDLKSQGFQTVRSVVTEADNEALRAMLDHKCLVAADRISDQQVAQINVTWNRPQVLAVRDMLPGIFSRGLGEALEVYFGAYFRIVSLSLARTVPIAANECSFMWHRDAEPAQQTHIMLYLTESTVQTGSTSFLTFADTRAAAQQGYSYPLPDQRVADLDDWQGIAEQSITPVRPDVNAGDALIFAASRVLHKGNAPIDGHRDAITMVVLPSPVPWQDYLERNPDIFVERHHGSAAIEPFGGTIMSDDGRRYAPGWAVGAGIMPDVDI